VVCFNARQGWLPFMDYIKPKAKDPNDTNKNIDENDGELHVDEIQTSTIEFENQST